MRAGQRTQHDRAGGRKGETNFAIEARGCACDGAEGERVCLAPEDNRILELYERGVSSEMALQDLDARLLIVDMTGQLTPPLVWFVANASGKWP